jgi:hypothetical protein
MASEEFSETVRGWGEDSVQKQRATCPVDADGQVVLEVPNVGSSVAQNAESGKRPTARSFALGPWTWCARARDFLTST